MDEGVREGWSGRNKKNAERGEEKVQRGRGGEAERRESRVREKEGCSARETGEKDAGVEGKGAAPATNFRARGHCGAGAWPRRRSKRKIDAVRGGEKQRARRDGGPAEKKEDDWLRGPERGRKMRAAAGTVEEGDAVLRRGE